MNRANTLLKMEKSRRRVVSWQGDIQLIVICIKAMVRPVSLNDGAEFCVGTGIAERVSALDWLSLRYAAIITLPVSNPGLYPKARHFIILASSVDRDVNGGPVGRN